MSLSTHAALAHSTQVWPLADRFRLRLDSSVPLAVRALHRSAEASINAGVELCRGLCSDGKFGSNCKALAFRPVHETPTDECNPLVETDEAVAGCCAHFRV